MFKWVKKGSKNISENVVDAGKNLVGTESIASATNEIKKMAGSVLSPREAIKNARKETFKEAMVRQKISDVDLVHIYKNYTIIFYINIAFSVLLFLLLIYKLFFKQEVLMSVSLLVFLGFCLVNAFKYSFRTFQIKHQKLCSVQEWWDRPNEWFPPIK